MTLSLADPIGSSPIADAAAWLQGTLLGTIATTVAVVAIASVGLMMLTGRVNLRRGATVVSGCFILFGATSIAAGIRSAVSGLGGSETDAVQKVAESPPIAIPKRSPNYDPYAGASVPPR